MKVVFGGTFDPVHVGHLRMAIDLYEALELALPVSSCPRSVDFLPCYDAVHKSGVAASPEQRVKMLSLSVAQEGALSVDDREIRRQSASFTIDTLRELRKEIGDEPLVFAMGSDAASSIEYWRDVAEYAKLCHVVVMQRPAVAKRFCDGFLRSVGFERSSSICRLATQRAGLLVQLEFNLLDISSSDIRQRVRNTSSIRYLVSSAVEQYICDNALYTKTLEVSP